MDNPLPYSEKDLESAACPMCSSKPNKTIQTFPPFGVVKCDACSFIYLSPRLNEAAMLRVYAANTYFEGGESYQSYERQAKSLRATFGRLLSELKKRGYVGGHLLDVGCGYGYLLEQATGLFERRSGLEFSDQGANHARAHAEVVYQTSIENTPKENRYSLICGIQLIEHIYNPHFFVSELVARLEKGGRVLLATPDIGSFWYPLFKRKWPSFKIPEHVSYFTKESLGRLLEKAGLTEIEEIPYPHAFPFTVVADKFGIKLPKSFNDLNFWIPKTTVALIGRKN